MPCQSCEPSNDGLLVHRQIHHESGMRFVQGLHETGNTDRMLFEVSLGKTLWAERDRDNECSKLNGWVLYPS
ncbi:Protein of unknown function [Pyronema omphalodes CBS 100304]|uniref:Uncharacterized protein n=1 Tax=Pyronema omphalodes (strain CBS 100304) TaxID=1076935 RepID=U4LPH2_PYROM|nr:Protein of unknown function [Pyronema omphalodes CBS 100304]